MSSDGFKAKAQGQDARRMMVAKALACVLRLRSALSMYAQLSRTSTGLSVEYAYGIQRRGASAGVCRVETSGTRTRSRPLDTFPHSSHRVGATRPQECRRGTHQPLRYHFFSYSYAVTD